MCLASPPRGHDQAAKSISGTAVPGQQLCGLKCNASGRLRNEGFPQSWTPKRADWILIQEPNHHSALMLRGYQVVQRERGAEHVVGPASGLASLYATVMFQHFMLAVAILNP